MLCWRRSAWFSGPPADTALSFSSPAKPVSTTRAARKVRYTLKFSIQNAEPRPHEYRWSVLLAQPGRPARVINSRTKNVVPGTKATITSSATIACQPGSVEFIVQSGGPERGHPRLGLLPPAPGLNRWPGARWSQWCATWSTRSKAAAGNCVTRSCCPGSPKALTCTSTPCTGGQARRYAATAGSATTPFAGCTRSTGTAAARSARWPGSRWPACACCAAGSMCWRPTRSLSSSCSYCGWWLRSSGSRSPSPGSQGVEPVRPAGAVPRPSRVGGLGGRAAGHATAGRDHRRVGADGRAAAPGAGQGYLDHHGA